MINTIEDLEKVLKLLRINGVSTFKLNGLELSMGELQIEEQSFIPGLPESVIPSQEELDRAVNLPVGGLEDPFLFYNETIAPDEN